MVNYDELECLQNQIDQMFPNINIDITKYLERLQNGEIFGVFQEFLIGIKQQFWGNVGGLKAIFLWLVVLGILSAVMGHVLSIFEMKQMSELGYYFVFLLLTTVLIKCYQEMWEIAQETIQQILHFIEVLIPTYMVCVGVVLGGSGGTIHYQIMLVLVYFVQRVLLGVALPVGYCFCIMVVMNGIWVESKLEMLLSFLEKGVEWILKGALGVVTGFGIFQATLVPYMSGVKKEVLEKVISFFPGLGDMAEAVVELAVGSGMVIKNCLGLLLLMLILLLCASPLCKIFLLSVVVKLSAAVMGIVCDKRLTEIVSKIGDGGLLLFRISGTALLLFMISLAAVTVSVYH